MTPTSKCVFPPLRRGCFTVVPQGRWRCFSTASNYDYDVIVVGGGPGGYVAAIKAAQLGLKSACIEKRGTLGGTCLNVGCIPSKAMLGIAHKYYEARTHFEKMGILTRDVSIDVKKMQQYKHRTVIGLTQGIEFLFKKNKVDYLKGEGRLSGPYTISITPIDGGDSQTVSAKNIILATGSEPAPLVGDALKVDERVVLTSTGALSLERVPRHLIVVGGGVIGLELGSVWRKLGADVTVIEYNNRLIPSIDHEVCRAFQKVLEREGIQFRFGVKVTGADVGSDSATLKLEDVKGGNVSTLDGDCVLLAVGRRPYTSGLGLDKVGIELDERGRVVVDEKLCVPTHPHIRAIGDLISGPMLAHKAEEEGIAVVEHIAGHGEPFINHENIPAVIYTHPELAGVGKTEEQLVAENIPFKKGTFPFAANSRARANDETDGLVKVLSCKETDKILGAWILGPSAGELLSEIVLAMEYGAASEDLGRVCHSHPTLSEAVKEACMACYDKPIHFA